MWPIVLYITPVTVSLACLTLIGAVFATAWWRSRAPDRALATTRALLTVWVALVLVATLTDQSPSGEHQFTWMPGQGLWEPSGHLGAGIDPQEAAMIWRLQTANVLMMLPTGAMTVLALPRATALRAVGACWALCLTIELTQAIGGRVADMDDVLCNGLGALAGAGLTRLCLRLTPPRSPRHRAHRGHARPRPRTRTRGATPQRTR